VKKRRPDPADPAAERAFLAAYDASAFDRPSVAVDVVLLGIVSRALVALLVRRAEHPYRGAHALPGVFLRLDESLDEAAARALREKAGLEGVFLEQLYSFGAVDRDPRTRVVAVAYYALVDAERFARAAGERGAVAARIDEIEDVPSYTLRDGLACTMRGAAGAPLTIAFDHAAIVATAVARIRGKLDYAPIGYELLDERFTLLELQRVHEIVGGRRLNKDSFRRKILASGLVTATRTVERDVGHRPATLYRYARPRGPQLHAAQRT
jgi:8-oxo-dGTP diphosphatase